MTQNFTDDCFAGTHVAQTDMQNIENNFLCCKSSFAGSAAPSNPTPGMPWFDIDTDQYYIRNKDNDQWLSSDFVPGTIIIFGQASSPIGWTKVTAWSDNSMLCINSQANGTALAAGGSDNPQAGHTHSVGSHTHTGPSHTHSLTGSVLQYSSANGSGEWWFVGSLSTGAEGTGATGEATLTTSANTVPLYHEVIACSKD